MGEYCFPVCINSSHTSLIDTQLNHTMHVILGAIRSTPTFLLPAFRHILPPYLWRKNVLLREYENNSNIHLTINADITDAIYNRLHSRYPPTGSARNLLDNNFNLLQEIGPNDGPLLLLQNITTFFALQVSQKDSIYPVRPGQALDCCLGSISCLLLPRFFPHIITAVSFTALLECLFLPIMQLRAMPSLIQLLPRQHLPVSQGLSHRPL